MFRKNIIYLVFTSLVFFSQMNASFEHQYQRLQEQVDQDTSCVTQYNPQQIEKLFKDALIHLINIRLLENGGSLTVNDCNELSRMIKELSTKYKYPGTGKVLNELRNYYRGRLMFGFCKPSKKLFIFSIRAGIIADELHKKINTMREENRCWLDVFNQDDSQAVAASVSTRLQEQNVGEPTQNDLDMANNYLKGCAMEVIFAPDCTDLIFRLTSINACLERFVEKHFLC